MSKYFKEEQLPKYELSEYLERDAADFKECIFDEESRKKRTKYLIDILGDVSLDEKTYKLFITEFQTFGGRYDVRTKKETLQGIYEITAQYPELTDRAIEEIWFSYIKDLFEEYALVDMLKKYLDIHGQTDDTFHTYLDFIERKAEEMDKSYQEAAKELDSYKEEYGESFVDYLKQLVQRQHIYPEEIKKSLPSSELVQQDQQQLTDLSQKTRIYLGVCLPISYQMTESLASKIGLDSYPEQPTYIISGRTQVATTFTKQDFIDSIKKHTSTEEQPKQLKKI